MGKIIKLPESLIRLIAAGEVVERPASVVKELVENSLDAGATRIAIDIWGAGRSRIRVSDNGEGMSREDAEQALDRHATSKLRSFDDLQNLNSFGFRGEALPSIAAVSRLELTTREPQASEGWQLKVEGGTLKSAAAIGISPGTTIDVQDLFFNTPARSKFMKRDSTERIHILRIIQELSLAHPHVGFEVTVEGKGAISVAPAVELRARLGDLWEDSLMKNLVSLEFSQGPIRVKGYINALPAHRPSKAHQYLFVNRRPVQQRLLTHAIYEAYHEWLPVGRHPAFLLFLDVDPTVVDVNVHPTKREVRFSNERMLYDLLFHHIRRLMQSRQEVPVIDGSGDGRDGGSVFSETSLPAFLVDAPLPRYANTLPLQTSVMVADLPAGQAGAPSPAKKLDGNIRILGQFQRVYVLAEQGEELLLIDQHAAAERVLYEKLLRSSHLGGGHTQPLLTPYIWELSPDRAERVREALPDLQRLGFVLEAFGSHAFVLKEGPAVFPQLRQAKRFLELFIESLEAEAHDHHSSASHETVARAACRAAIKASDALAPQEMEHLLKELAACERPMTCPHGRPTHIRLPLSELHRRFRRT